MREIKRLAAYPEVSYKREDWHIIVVFVYHSTMCSITIQLWSLKNIPRPKKELYARNLTALCAHFRLTIDLHLRPLLDHFFYMPVYLLLWSPKPRPDWYTNSNSLAYRFPCMSGWVCIIYIAQLALLYSTPILGDGGILFGLMVLGLMVRPRHSFYASTAVTVICSTLNGGEKTVSIYSKLLLLCMLTFLRPAVVRLYV